MGGQPEKTLVNTYIVFTVRLCSLSGPSTFLEEEDEDEGGV